MNIEERNIFSRFFSAISEHKLGESYPSAEMQ